MPKPGSKKIIAVVADLFFSVKITDTAKRAGLEVVYAKTEQDALELAKTAPLLMILDLNNNNVEAVKLISQLKGSPETKSVNLVGFVSHIQGELKQKAHDAGCNMVLARSAFSQNLPLILKRHASAVA